MSHCDSNLKNPDRFLMTCFQRRVGGGGTAESVIHMFHFFLTFPFAQITIFHCARENRVEEGLAHIENTFCPGQKPHLE